MMEAYLPSYTMDGSAIADFKIFDALNSKLNK